MLSVSLDGYFEGPNGELDWQLVDDELHEHFNEVLAAMGAFLSGRVTHELMAGFWPTADEDPASTKPMVEFARIWREMPKIVYSTKLDHADWNATVVRDVVPAEVLKLKEQPGGDLALGGANVAAAFMRYDLIERVQALRASGAHRTREEAVRAVRRQGRPAARRDPLLRQRGRPASV